MDAVATHQQLALHGMVVVPSEPIDKTPDPGTC
jgi:hypothetical protein